MDYAPDQIKKTTDLMAAARKKGLENERKTGAHSGSGLTQEQRASVMATAKAAEGLYLDENIKVTLLERFVMWSEHHGTKVENEKHPYILRQLVDEFMRNDDWMRSGYDGKIGATIRGAIIEKADRIDPNAPLKKHFKPSVAAKAVAEKAAPLAAVPEQEVDQFMQDARAAFKTSGHTLRGTTASIPAHLAKVVDSFADAGSLNKFTLRHLLATFGKMADRAAMVMSDSMAAAVLPKLSAELSANKEFLKGDNAGMIPLTVKEGDVSKDMMNEFPFLCEKAPEIVRRTVLAYQPAKEHLQKVMRYFEGSSDRMPVETRLYSANARAVAEYRHDSKRSAKAADATAVDAKATSKPDASPAAAPEAPNEGESMMPSWLMPARPKDTSTHAGRVIEGDWSRKSGRKK